MAEQEKSLISKNKKTLVCPDLNQYIQKSGIYKLIFDDSFFYVGRSENLVNRILHWIDRFYRTDHHTPSKYMLDKIPLGFKKIEIVVMEMCRVQDLVEKEDEYIRDKFFDEYCLNVNCTLGCKSKNPKDRSSEFKSIFISKTQWEWDIISQKIADLGKKNLITFIRHEVRKLGNNYKNDSCPIKEDFGKKICKRPSISTSSYEKLHDISTKMKIPVSSVVDRLIIQPLLRP